MENKKPRKLTRQGFERMIVKALNNAYKAKFDLLQTEMEDDESTTGLEKERKKTLASEEFKRYDMWKQGGLSTFDSLASVVAQTIEDEKGNSVNWRQEWVNSIWKKKGFLKDYFQSTNFEEQLHATKGIWEKLKETSSILTFEDWQSNKWPDWATHITEPFVKLRKSGDRENRPFFLTNEEYLKIAAAQKVIFEQKVDLFLKGQIDGFEKRYTNSLEPDSLIKLELQNVNQWLTDETLSGEYTFLNPNRDKITFTDRYRKEGEDANMFPKWYNKVIVNGGFKDAAAYIESIHRNEGYLPYPCAVHVLYSYKKYLEKLSLRGKEALSEPVPISPNNLQVLELAQKMRLVNESGKWTYKPIELPFAALVWYLRDKNIIDPSEHSPSASLQALAKEFGLKGKHKNTWNKFPSARLKKEAERLLRDSGE